MEIDTHSTETEVNKTILNNNLKLLNMTFAEYIQEKRRTRRWNLFFRFFWLVFFSLTIILIYSLLVSVFPLTSTTVRNQEGILAVIPINGTIASDSIRGNYHYLHESLTQVEENAENVKGLVLLIDSPGGSPSQADIMMERINAFRKDHPTIPVYAVIEDIAASGGYYVAVAADTIIANRNSLVGSIGVIMSQWEAIGLAEKIGIKENTFVTGQYKDTGNPLREMRENEKDYLQAEINKIFNTFVNVVRTNRKNRLIEAPDIFSGKIWNGEEAVEIGLIDTLGDLYQLHAGAFPNTQIQYFGQVDEFDQFFQKFLHSTVSLLANKFSAPALR